MKGITLTAILAAAGLLLAAPRGVFGQDYGHHASVHMVEGTSHVQPRGDGPLQTLEINLPILEGDTVWTDGGGKADLLLEEGSHLILDGGTRIQLDRLPSSDPQDGRALRIQLWKGSLLLDCRSWNETTSRYVLTSPSAALTPARAGLFLLEVESVDRTRAVCVEGSCEVSSAGDSVRLDSRQMSYAEYGYPPLAPMASTTLPEGLMRFHETAVARHGGNANSVQYLPATLSAYASDLDAGGEWTNVPSYGNVWRPSDLPSDWTPYTNGEWTWNDWGMTWVPYESWGWAPFHYGRWVYGPGWGWGWSPMPFFAPAWCDFWWDDAGWLGWCPLDFWGGPLWGPCGWNSCWAGNLYGGPVHGWITHHHDSPPPNPIVPRAHGSVGGLHGSGPRGGTGNGTGGRSITAAGGLNLSPQSVRAFHDKKITGSDVRSRLTAPVSVDRRSYPSIQSGDAYRTREGSGRTDPSYGGARRDAGTVQGTTARSRDTNGATQPRQPVNPVPGRSWDRSTPLPSIRPETSSRTEPRYSNTGTGRGPTSSQPPASGYRNGGESPAPRYGRGGSPPSSNPYPSRPVTVAPNQQPRYIPSRSSVGSGSSSASHSSSGGASSSSSHSSGGGGGGHHH